MAPLSATTLVPSCAAVNTAVRHSASKLPVIQTRQAFPPTLQGAARRSLSLQQINFRGNRVQAAAPEALVEETVEEGWWTRESADNMKDVKSLRELTAELEAGRDKLVIVDFYAQWCNSCRALYPKLCKIARENPSIVFLKVNWKDNKVLCKSLGIRSLPYFHFYRGAEGRVEAFTASITKIKRLKDAINLHSTPRCSLGPSMTTKDLVNLVNSDPSPSNSGVGGHEVNSNPSSAKPLAGAML